MNTTNISVVSFGSLKDFVKAFSETLSPDSELLLQNTDTHVSVRTSGGLKEIAQINYSFTSKKKDETVNTVV